MSRVGKNPILIPKEVEIKITEQTLNILGKHGKFEHKLPFYLEAIIDNNFLTLNNISLDKENRKFHGLNRNLLANKIKGVSEPFKKVLIAQGVGYRFQVANNKMTLAVGFSHPVVFEIPKEIEANVEANIRLTLTCIDKAQLGQFAATIRAVRPPEPYKGKGIKYENEIILRKAGKAGK
jgi:large subunit ribosomal protein L6